MRPAAAGGGAGVSFRPRGAPPAPPAANCLPLRWGGDRPRVPSGLNFVSFLGGGVPPGILPAWGRGPRPTPPQPPPNPAAPAAAQQTPPPAAAAATAKPAAAAEPTKPAAAAAGTAAP